jgi:hypothetical protein
MEMNYDQSNGLLNLQALAGKPGLGQMNVDFNDENFANAISTAITSKARNVKTLILADNKIASLKNYGRLFLVCCNIQNLSLQNNLIATFAEFDHIRSSNLKNLLLEGNPIMQFEVVTYLV